MSIAAAQASAFYQQAAKDGAVFTFLEDDGFLVFSIRGQDVVPFWSSRSRMAKVQAAHPKYARYAIDEIPLAEFLGKTLRLLEAEGIHVGVNWSGKGLTGYDIPVEALRRNLGYWLSPQM